MAVSPLNPALPYSVNASNEASDNSRQRQDKNPSQESTNPKLKQLKNENRENPQAPLHDLSSEPEATELTGQIIDSSKVIELLSHRPKLKKSVTNCFSSNKKSKEKSQFADVKKLNKAF